jgi:hypothetical protein
MNIRSFRIVPVAVSVIMALATGCGTIGTISSSSASPAPELAEITVAALPAADLAGLFTESSPRRYVWSPIARLPRDARATAGRGVGSRLSR